MPLFKVYIIRSRVHLDSIWKTRVLAKDACEKLNKELREHTGGYVDSLQKYSVEEWEVH